MDASSIITQVSRDDDQLGSYPTGKNLLWSISVD